MVGQPRMTAAPCDQISTLARQIAALLAGDADRLARLLNENFDTRRSIYQLPPAQIEMVERARQALTIKAQR